MKTAIPILVAIALTGCAAPAPTAQEINSADYGPYPDQYKEAIQTYMAGVLRDPESARYEFSATPAKAWYGTSSKEFGWAVCAHINAKNGYGGYTGAQKAYFFLRDGRVSQANTGGPEGSFSQTVVYEMCSKL